MDRHRHRLTHRQTDPDKNNTSFGSMDGVQIIITSLPKVIGEQGRVADVCQRAGCHQGSTLSLIHI